MCTSATRGTRAKGGGRPLGRGLRPATNGLSRCIGGSSRRRVGRHRRRRTWRRTFAAMINAFLQPISAGRSGLRTWRMRISTGDGTGPSAPEAEGRRGTRRGAGTHEREVGIERRGASWTSTDVACSMDATGRTYGAPARTRTCRGEPSCARLLTALHTAHIPPMRRRRHRCTCAPKPELRSSSIVIWGALVSVVPTALRRPGVEEALFSSKVSGSSHAPGL